MLDQVLAHLPLITGVITFAAVILASAGAWYRNLKVMWVALGLIVLKTIGNAIDFARSGDPQWLLNTLLGGILAAILIILHIVPKMREKT